MKKSDNKGFSLVELILAVAVIAVLITFISLQFIEYVEFSRQSNDLQTATQILKATKVAIADPRSLANMDAMYNVTWVTTHSSDEWIIVNRVDTGDMLETTNSPDEVALRDVMTQIVGFSEPDEAFEHDDRNQVFPHSDAGKAQNFEFVIDVESGKIEVVDTSHLWVDLIGVDENVKHEEED